MKNLCISFSGGETSALMTKLLLNNWRSSWAEIIVLFANTGQENEQTLEFVRDCDKAFGFKTVWLEADVKHGTKTGTGHKVVSFETASRDGYPYEEMIKKYGIPNIKMPHCTRELKLRPIQAYINSIGWVKGSYDTAIGIRADEIGRKSKNPVNIIYPLIDMAPLTKQHVNKFWSEQEFRLNLTGYQGNCKWCWKKSTRKLLTLLDENPSQFDFPERMETLYGFVGAEFKKDFRSGYCRTFFRGNLSTLDLKKLLALNKDCFVRADDDSVAMPDGSLFPLDLSEGCIESCEVEFE